MTPPDGSKRNRSRRSLCVWAALAAVGSAGCENEIRPSGPDIAILESPSGTAMTATLDNPLLSLKKGNFWEMMAYRQNVGSSEVTVTRDRYVVHGPITVGGIAATEIRILRNGKTWRREVYRMNGPVLELVAAQDENSELMRYSPPVPLFKYPVREGDYLNWAGTFTIRGETLAARALSRISGQETVQTPAAVFKTLRVDTMIALGDGQIKFPSARWFAPGVGFVRRGYAEMKNPASAEVVRFGGQ
ncbi:MAG: hypothetical protein SFU56_10695 [Capsulimonadales bacterium]|nr:hypothetical protein [Capsulimonadales bacterium]